MKVLVLLVACATVAMASDFDALAEQSDMSEFYMLCQGNCPFVDGQHTQKRQECLDQCRHFEVFASDYINDTTTEEPPTTEEPSSESKSKGKSKGKSKSKSGSSSSSSSGSSSKREEEEEEYGERSWENEVEDDNEDKELRQKQEALEREDKALCANQACPCPPFC